MTADPTLYAKYLDRAELAFARLDAQRCPPDPDARFMLGLINAGLNKLSAAPDAVRHVPYRLPSDWRDAGDEW